MQAELKRVRRRDEDIYHFTSDKIGKIYPHRKMSRSRTRPPLEVETSDIALDSNTSLSDIPEHGLDQQRYNESDTNVVLCDTLVIHVIHGVGIWAMCFQVYRLFVVDESH